jgi:hypothetical protein
VTFRANEAVYLSPGFQTETNALFSARINNPCAANNLREGFLGETPGDSTVNSDKISVFPNPNNGNFSIALFQGDASKVDFVLSDIYGNTIKKFSEEASVSKIVEVDMGNYAAGVYSLRYINKGKQSVMRIIVNK